MVIAALGWMVVPTAMAVEIRDAPVATFGYDTPACRANSVHVALERGSPATCEHITTDDADGLLPLGASVCSDEATTRATYDYDHLARFVQGGRDGQDSGEPVGIAEPGCVAVWRPKVAAKYGDDAIEGIGDARNYVNLTKGGSIRNVGTNTTHTEFAETLTSGGWMSRTSKDGAVQIFQRDGAKYVLRSKNSSGYAGWTADFTPAGSTRHTLEIRLGYVP